MVYRRKRNVLYYRPLLAITQLNSWLGFYPQVAGCGPHLSRITQAALYNLITCPCTNLHRTVIVYIPLPLHQTGLLCWLLCFFSVTSSLEHTSSSVSFLWTFCSGAENEPGCKICYCLQMSCIFFIIFSECIEASLYGLQLHCIYNCI